MTQKNGTIEFIRDPEKQCAGVYIPHLRKTVKFNLHSNKFFTSDPLVIKKLDSLQYKRGKIKIDGIAVESVEMTEDEKKRVQKNVDREASKLGVETVKVVSESEVEVKPNKEVDEKKTDELDKIENGEKENKKVDVLVKKVEKPAKKKAGKKPSEKLKKEIG